MHSYTIIRTVLQSRDTTEPLAESVSLFQNCGFQMLLDEIKGFMSSVLSSPRQKPTLVRSEFSFRITNENKYSYIN